MTHPRLLALVSLCLFVGCGSKGVLPDTGLPPDTGVGEDGGPPPDLGFIDGEVPDQGFPEDADVPDLGFADAGDAGIPIGACQTPPSASMSFFVTEAGNLSGNFGGISGADAFCQQFAEAAGIVGRTWRAYLSAMADGTFGRVDAKDRIGNGPWFNHAGASVGDNAIIHSSGIPKDNVLTECGRKIIVDINMLESDEGAHDIFTGTTPFGTLEFLVDPNSGVREGIPATCADWTSGSAGDKALVGHSDANGPDDSWNWAHDTNGCNEAALRETGANGRVYCFAID